MHNGEIHILLVEDNPGDEILFSESMREAIPGQVNVEFADRLSSALEYLKRNEYDLIALDLCLPDSIGLRTLQSVKKYSKESPVMVLTGMEDEKLKTQVIEMGAAGYCVKDGIDSFSYLKPVVELVKSIPAVKRDS